MDNSVTYEYLPWRGVTASSFRHYNAKTRVSAEGKPEAIGYIYPNGSYKVRQLDKKDFKAYPSADGKEIGQAGLFGRNLFDPGSHKYVTITEGELDAISLYQVLQSPVVSVHSSSSAKLDCSIDRSWLNSFERIYLAFDADGPGRDATRAVANLFDYNKLYQVKFTKYKDANEYLVNGEHEELRNIWWNSKKYVPDTIISSFSDFEKILTEPMKSGISYPFPTLSYMTYGIRTGESVLITAQEGVGKTEIMHTIEHHILKETKDVDGEQINLGAIFLEEPKKRHLQALSGLTLRMPVHLPDSGVSETEAVRALRELVVADDRLHVYSHFGSDDPDVILDTIRFLASGRSCRYILLDHVNMVVSGLAGENERKALDYFSTRLEMMVKELDFALIMVAHVNDEGLTRGSRYISKVADIRIDASRDIKNEDPIERNTIHLMVSKNRFCGRTGPAGRLKFDPITYTLSEDVPFGGVPANENEPMEKAA